MSPGARADPGPSVVAKGGVRLDGGRDGGAEFGDAPPLPAYPDVRRAPSRATPSQERRLLPRQPGGDARQGGVARSSAAAVAVAVAVTGEQEEVGGSGERGERGEDEDGASPSTGGGGGGGGVALLVL